MAPTSITDVEAVINSYVADQEAISNAALAAADAAVLDKLRTTDAATLASVSQKLTDTLNAFAAYKLAYPPTMPAPGSHDILWGANYGGKSASETAAIAFARINTAFGGVDMARWWKNAEPTFNDIPSFLGKLPLMIEVDVPVSEVIANKHTGDLTAMFKATPLTSSYVFTPWHEMNAHAAKGEYTPAEVQKAQTIFMNLFAEYAPSNAYYMPILTGGEFITNAPGPEPDRRANKTYHYTDYLPLGMSKVPRAILGADCYQHGKDDATADTAETILRPCIDAAKALGVGLGIGELGTRSLLSDKANAKFLTDVGKIVDAEAQLFYFILYYESWAGQLGPWNITNGDKPQANAVFKAFCQRNKLGISI